MDKIKHTHLTEEFLDGTFVQDEMRTFIHTNGLIGFPLDEAGDIFPGQHSLLNKLVRHIKHYLNLYDAEVIVTESGDGFIETITAYKGRTCTIHYNKQRQVIKHSLYKDRTWDYDKHNRLIQVNHNGVSIRKLTYAADIEESNAVFKTVIRLEEGTQDIIQTHDADRRITSISEEDTGQFIKYLYSSQPGFICITELRGVNEFIQETSASIIPTLWRDN